jgi:cholesterol oxidase
LHAQRLRPTGCGSGGGRFGALAICTEPDDQVDAHRHEDFGGSNVLGALGNIPTTAHLVGGAVIGADAASGVIDRQLRVFGHRNLLICDGAAMPANPGVNPALTITALAEYAMTHVPGASPAHE